MPDTERGVSECVMAPTPSHGTLEAPLPPCGASSFSEFVHSGASFFRLSMSPVFWLTIRAWVTWARGAADGGHLFRGFVVEAHAADRDGAHMHAR